MSKSKKRNIETAFEGDHSQSKQKKHKHKGSSRKKQSSSAVSHSATTEPTDAQGNSSTAKPTSSKSSKSRKWVISSAIGGIFLDRDPILTADSKHLLLLTKDHVNVYSVTTSLLVRSISISKKEKDTITNCSISASNAANLLVATRKGVVKKIDWSTGATEGSWKIGAELNVITSFASKGSSENLLAVRSTGGQDDQLLLISLGQKYEADTKILLQAQSLQKIIGTSRDASTIVVYGDKTLYVGVRRDVSDLEYTWYKQPTLSTICSGDARISKREKSKNKNSPLVDIVLGFENGAIHLYKDALTPLIRSTKRGHQEDLNGRKLHWHRTSVRSVKWSKDGNYVVSGGDETVLVIWQLETDQQQFLPHLSASILNITVSSTGAEYVLQLGDNSVMVLPTADLLPSANITGLAITPHRDEIHPMQLHPLHSNQLLATVSVRSAHKGSNNAATHLQTYDIESNLQLNRQALTRNVTTTVNVSPSGQELHEPSVIHLQISVDGNWLATVDEWSPKSSDTQAMYLDHEDSAERREITETVLRIWSWNSDENSWDLANRVDAPHVSCKSSVLGLASNPTRPEFATMGQDGWVKIWHPRKRVRDGVQVRDSAGQPLFVWTCARSVLVEKSNPNKQQSAGSLAYSEDGSLLTASWSLKQRHVHVIDTTTAKLCMSLPDLLSEGSAALAVLGRYLVCLSSTLRLFDMITLQTTFTMDIGKNRASFLAVNSRANTFAIGLNPPERDAKSLISIFNTENPEQGSLGDFRVLRKIHCLLTEPTSQGFVVVDDDCKIRKIVPSANMSIASQVMTRALDVENVNIIGALDNVFGPAKSNAGSAEEEQQKAIDAVTSSRNLADLFATTSTAAQPGVRELFDQVAKAISGTQALASA